MKTYLDVAILAAKEAGKLLVYNLNNAEISRTAYNSQLVLKTKQDDESESLIVEIIKDSFPSHSILAEESTDLDSGSPYRWIIDPIDGTNNYLEGRDTFSVSIGLWYVDKVVLGVVYLPKRNELFVAQKGNGSFLNGRQIKVGIQKDLKMADITFSTFPGREDETQYLQRIVYEKIPGVRDFGFKDKNKVDPVFGRGSMAAEFCYLACGRIDGLIRLKQKPWDVAAGSLIASEARARMVNLRGTIPSIWEGDYIAANPLLVQQLAENLSLKS